MITLFPHSKNNQEFLLFLNVFLLLFIFVEIIPADNGINKQKDDWSSLKTGKDVYVAACITCHGARGQGADPTLLGFEPDPPNFTDCKFTSREKSKDWLGIATLGGPMKGFSTMMPAFGKALTREQISAVIAFLKEICTENTWPPGEFNLPKALNTGKAFPEDEVVWSVSANTEDPVSFKGKFIIARRIGARHQIEAVLPIDAYRNKPDIKNNIGHRWRKGVGDIAAAWKSILWFSRSANNIGSVTLDLFFPTGNRGGDEIGSGVLMFEPAIAFGQIIPHIGFLQLQGGAELFADTAVKKHVAFWRGAFGHTFQKGSFGKAFSPMVEVLGEKELSNNSSVEWSIVPQFQIALSKRQHIRLGSGMVIPMTDFDTRPLNFMAYLTWDWYDGGFMEGWK